MVYNSNNVIVLKNGLKYSIMCFLHITLIAICSIMQCIIFLLIVNLLAISLYNCCCTVLTSDLETSNMYMINAIDNKKSKANTVRLIDFLTRPDWLCCEL